MRFSTYPAFAPAVVVGSNGFHVVHPGGESSEGNEFNSVNGQSGGAHGTNGFSRTNGFASRGVSPARREEVVSGRRLG
jgi:hypothetical protein